MGDLTALVAGPYWVRTNTNGTHDVCGRHSKVVRQYRAEQMAIADADCRRLQAKFSAADKQVRDAAPALFDALENLVIGIGMGWDLDGLVDTARAALAAATPSQNTETGR